MLLIESVIRLHAGAPGVNTTMGDVATRRVTRGGSEGMTAVEAPVPLGPGTVPVSGENASQGIIRCR